MRNRCLARIVSITVERSCTVIWLEDVSRTNERQGQSFDGLLGIIGDDDFDRALLTSDPVQAMQRCS